MRNIPKILVVAAAASILTLPLAYAADQNDSSTSSQGHVQQHQQVVPSSPSPKSDSQDSDSRRDQSAQAPIITPPSTGDKSVITPPADGASKMPVIKPPGSPGNLTLTMS